MSDSPIIDLDQDYVLLNTTVTVGRSYSSRGWALSRSDIHDWIPVEEFEGECKLLINNICSDAILRFNPRLFYESDELSLYLKELYENGWYKDKIPMSIKINKNNLFSNIKFTENYLKLDFIETELLVGKSYKSKGWQLSKSVVLKLFPTEEYDEEYSICIDNIKSNAKLNLQFRLFYKSNKLSKYLEKLHNKNPRDKIPAKIIFEVNSKNVNEPVKPKDESPLSNVCHICGKSYDSNIKSLDFEGKFSNTCPDCIEKITVLNIYTDIKNSSFSNFIKKENVEEIISSNFDEKWDLLIEYNFLIPFGELFKLNGNELIENTFSQYLPNISSNIKHSSKKRNRNKILELINEEENEINAESEKSTCMVCGKILNDSDSDKCESCIDKALATEYLREIVTKVPYGSNFSKLNLLDMGIVSLNAELYLKKLSQYNLISSQSDILYQLTDVSFLNDFVKRYSENPYQLQVNYVNDDSDVLKISKKDLVSEDKIDSIVKWKNFADFITFKKGQYGFISVQFKQNGQFLYSKGYNNSYEAKVNAITYLKSLGIVLLVDEDEVKLEFI